MRLPGPTFVLVLLLAVLPAAVSARQDSVSAAQLGAAINQLGDFDFSTRTEAARTVRRAASGQAAEALIAAVRGHEDEYVRYRALVLLAGIGEAAAAPVMRAAMTDHNDRLRTVAFAWFEHHPDPEVLPALLEGLEREGSEFVRPAVTRAVAAQSSDPRAQAALEPLILRGEDFFRGAVIEAIGDFKGVWALDTITRVARLDGPLQDDAITAIGRIGSPDSAGVLAELQRQVPRQLQPTVSASLCLLGRSCETQVPFIVESLEFGAANENFQPLLRGASHALGMLALRGSEEAMTILLDVGTPSSDPARSPIALSVGLVALRNPEVLLAALESRPDRDAAIVLLRDAFDMLSEDFEEERFFVHVRRAYWAAAEGSARRALAEALIRTLEF